MRTPAAVPAICLFCSALHAQPEEGWKIEKIGKLDYLAVAQIQRYYRFADERRAGDTITLENPKIRMDFDVGSTRCSINGVNFGFLEVVREVESKAYISRRDLSLVIDPVLRPNFIKRAGNFKTVILDPGHGGNDPGIVNDFGTEAANTLKLALLTRDLLKTAGYNVVLTREDDRNLLLQQRVEIANAIEEGAIFISLSFNSGPKDQRGIETFPLAGDDGDANDFRSASMALACATHGQIVRRLGNHSLDRGIRQLRHSVLAAVKHPAALIECGFMTHKTDARMIAMDIYQSMIARAIADGVEKYRFAVGSQHRKELEEVPKEP